MTSHDITKKQISLPNGSTIEFENYCFPETTWLVRLAGCPQRLKELQSITKSPERSLKGIQEM